MMSKLDNIAAKLIFGANLAQADKDFAARYLSRFYLPAIVTDKIGFNVTKKFQKSIGIEVDGEIGPQTIRAMEYPRCGISDALAVILELSQWKGKKLLTYEFQSYVSILSKSRQEEMFFNAVNSWKAICGISFDITRSGNSNILINASSLRREEFGRSGGVLAWCELPQGDNRQLQLKIDDAETWTDDPVKPGIYYQSVI